ncbi:MAG: capsid assembly scaffolding protein Gp46 family protein [Clostridium sp.]|uniref:capsid assembly scaffolding protein Gp46 family protein n=1 Tax=Clostridia TaxID=186801 RepID=UPI003F3C7CAB
MTKLELMKLIENIENENGDITDLVLSQGFAKPIADEEGFNNLVATNEIVQKMIDSRIGKGITTYQNGTEKQHIEEALSKLRAELTGNNETPEQKAIRELTEKLNSMELEKRLVEIGLSYKDRLQDSGIPKELHTFILGKDTDENTINERLELFKGVLGNLQKGQEEVVQKQVNERLNGGYKPPVQAENVSTAMNKESFLNLGLAEQMKFASENPEAYREIMN